MSIPEIVLLVLLILVLVLLWAVYGARIRPSRICARAWCMSGTA